MTAGLSRWVLIAMGVVAATFWWLLIAPDQGAAPAHPVHIGELRTLAAAMPGRQPTNVNYTLLGTRKTVGDFVAAGIGLKRRPLAVVAWTLPVPGKGPIMIDPGVPRPEAGVGTFDNFDRAKQRRLDVQARAATLVLHTQADAHTLPGRADRDATAQAVAPGVVVIPAPSHAPGARMIFVHLADGREFLFAGGIATFSDNWVRLRARSHLAAIRGPVQNRAETYAWLRTIRQLHSEAPGLKIVPGYDYGWLAEQWTTGALAEARLPPVPSGRSMPTAGNR